VWRGAVDRVCACPYYGRLRRQLLAPSAQHTTHISRKRRRCCCCCCCCDATNKCRRPVLREYRFDIWPGCSSPLTDCNATARTARNGLSWTVWDEISTRMRSLLFAGWALPRRPCWRTTGSRGPTTVAKRLSGGWPAGRGQCRRPTKAFPRRPKSQRRISKSVNQAEHPPSVSAPEAGCLAVWLLV
jgi:hypothetical protein